MVGQIITMENYMFACYILKLYKYLWECSVIRLEYDRITQVISQLFQKDGLFKEDTKETLNVFLLL